MGTASTPLHRMGFTDMRRTVMEDILTRSYRDGALGANVRPSPDELAVIRRELMFLSLMAWEYHDAAGPFAGDARLRRVLLPALERIGGRLAAADARPFIAGPAPFFALIPFTRALSCLRPHVDAAWWERRLAEGEALYAGAARHMDRTHEYLNARALEAVSCLNLHRLTGKQDYLDRCHRCLDELVKRQYACGAQPYHTGMWVWGRRPAQVYQFLSASLMLYAGRELGRQDAIDYVRRVADYALTATDRFGAAFVTCFEGLHKSASLACAGRQWVTATVLGDERFRGLARRAYEVYMDGLIDDPFKRHENYRHEALTEALSMGVVAAPAPAEYRPPPGVRALEDISTVMVHGDRLDWCMTVLTGYSAFAEGSCGNVTVYAVTPELTDEPTFSNCGTDALRPDWQRPTEQIECASSGGRGVVRGWVYTKWERNGTKAGRYVHNRRLGVTMTVDDGEWVLDFETLKHWHPDRVPCRLLVLLLARPFDQPGRLIMGGKEYRTPPAETPEPFQAAAPVGRVCFMAPDGSGIEIIPEVSHADRITAERPPAGSARPANEGSLRLAFEGPGVLDRGRYRVRFIKGTVGVAS